MIIILRKNKAYHDNNDKNNELTDENNNNHVRHSWNTYVGCCYWRFGISVHNRKGIRYRFPIMAASHSISGVIVVCEINGRHSIWTIFKQASVPIWNGAWSFLLLLPPPQHNFAGVHDGPRVWCGQGKTSSTFLYSACGPVWHHCDYRVNLKAIFARVDQTAPCAEFTTCCLLLSGEWDDCFKRLNSEICDCISKDFVWDSDIP